MPIRNIETKLTPERKERNRQVFEEAGGSLESYAPTTVPAVNPSLNYLENNEKYQEDVQTYMDYIGSQDDNFLTGFLAGNNTTPDWKEFMRDGDYRLTSVIDRYNALKDAPQEVKEAYNRVREDWDRAEVNGYSEWVDVITDMGIDIVADPLNLATLVTAPFTAGGSAAVGAVAKEGTKALAKQTLKNMVTGATRATGAAGGATSGAIWSGTDNFYRQSTEVATGLRDEFSNGEFALSIGIGSAFGSAIGFGVGHLNMSKHAARVETNIIPEIKALEDRSVNFPPNEKDGVASILNDNLPEAAAIRESVSSILSTIKSKDVGPVKEAGTDVGPSRTSTSKEMEFQYNIIDLDRGDWFEIIEEQAELLSNKFGGGQRTKEEFVDIIRAEINRGTRGKRNIETAGRGVDQPSFAPESTTTITVQAEVGSKLLYKLGRAANKLNAAALAGKATDYLSPYAKYSKTAARLQSAFRYDSTFKITGNKTPDTVAKQDFFEVFKESSGTFITTFKRAYDPILLNAKGEVKETANDLMLAALRGKALPTDSSSFMRESVATIRTLLDKRAKELGIKDQPANYVPRMWKRGQIKNREFKFKELLVKEGYKADEAEAITASMLGKNTEYLIDTGSGSNNIFLTSRVLDKIKNDNAFSDFLENDLNLIMNEYGVQTARRIAKKKVLGVENEKHFANKWMPRIQQELEASGFDDDMIVKANNDIQTLYRSVTGENVERFGSDVQAAVDTYTLGTRMALLPLATLSSVTEIFINIAKAGGKNTTKGILGAMNGGFDTIAYKSKKMLGNKEFGLTEPEIWKEMQELGIAMDQAAGDVADRLGGDAISNKNIRSANNKFFRATFLDQWTKFVQMSSYITGKNMIRDNIIEVAGAKGLKPTNRILRKQQELKELGVNVNDAVRWVDGGMNEEDAFTKQIQRGAGRYTNEVILNPEAGSGIKPMLHSNPKTAILFQLMGYPAAFTNVILKNGARKLIENPIANGPQTLAAAMIMTEVARFTNYTRSNGRSEEGDENPYARAVARWGGNGLYLDMFQRFQQNKEYLGPLAIPTAMTGPIAQDVTTVARRGNLIEFVGKKAPGYGAFQTVFGRDFKSNYDSALRKWDRELKSLFSDKQPKSRQSYEQGGIVSNVPNASEEPDERIDKLTGLPYNEQAGGSNIDVEDRFEDVDMEPRFTYAIGGLANKLTGIMLKTAKKGMNRGQAEEAALRIDDVINNLYRQSTDPAKPVDPEIAKIADDYSASTTKALLEEKHDIPKVDLSTKAGGKNDPLTFSTKRGYTPDEIASYMEAKALGAKLPDEAETNTVRNEIASILDSYKVRNMEYQDQLDNFVDEFDMKAELSEKDFAKYAKQKQEIDDRLDKDISDAISLSSMEPTTEGIGESNLFITSLMDSRTKEHNKLIDNFRKPNDSIFVSREIKDYPKITKFVSEMDASNSKNKIITDLEIAVEDLTNDIKNFELDKRGGEDLSDYPEGFLEDKTALLKLAQKDLNNFSAGDASRKATSSAENQFKEMLNGLNPKQLARVKRINDRFPEPLAAVEPPSSPSNASDFTKDSFEQELRYRLTGSNLEDFQYDVAFASPQETGVHVGTREQSENYFNQKAASDPDKPYTMVRGYIDVKEPLIIDQDLNRWDVTAFNADEQSVVLANLKEHLISTGSNKSIEPVKDFFTRLKTDLSSEDSVILMKSQELGLKGKEQLYGNLLRGDLNREFTELLEFEYDIDGIKYLNIFETPEGSKSDPFSYILFRPEQFKSDRAVAFDPDDPRFNYAEGSLVERAFKSIITKGAEKLGITSKDLRNHEKKAVAVVNQGVDGGFFPERARIPTDDAGFGKFQGDNKLDLEVFNAVNHALLSYNLGKNPVMRTALQAKEFMQEQYYPDSNTEKLDRYNNSFGFNMREKYDSEQKAINALFVEYQNTQNKLEAGERLKRGENLIFNVNDLGLVD